MTGHEYMKAIKKVRRHVRLLGERIEREYALAAGVTAIQYDRDKVQTSPVADRMADVVANIMEHMDELNNELIKLQSMEEEAERYLLQLDEKYERVLSLHYMSGKPWNKVAEWLGFNEKYIYTLKEESLLALSELLENDETTDEI